MKLYSTLFILLISCSIHAQDISLMQLERSFFNDDFSFTQFDPISNEQFMTLPKATQVVAIQSGDGFFHRSFAMDEHGDPISSGFMPSPYFQANTNKIVITGGANVRKDSFNPYGARDMASMLVYGTFNSFISRFRIGGK